MKVYISYKQIKVKEVSIIPYYNNQIIQYSVLWYNLDTIDLQSSELSR